MPQTPTGRRTPLLRVLGFVVAAGLGIVGVWLIVTGNSSKNVRIGAIAAFWGLLIGTYAVFGSRLPSRPADPPPAAPQPPPPPSRELDVRQVSEIERSAVAAARREFAEELQLMLRRETQAGFAQEVAGLRAEVSALRNDLVEKVGGQLRLERIETTRLIGSDLEALQSELRKLRETTRDSDGGQPPRLPVAIPVPPHTEIHEAEIVSDETHVTVPVGPHLAEPVRRAPDPQPAPPTTGWPTPTQAPPPAPSPPRAAPAHPATVPAAPARAAAETPPRVEQPQQPQQRQQRQQPQQPPEPAPAPTTSADPFAGMPRITPFTEFPLDPVPSTPEPDTGSGRRHRAEDDSNDTLARILAREHTD